MTAPAKAFLGAEILLAASLESTFGTGIALGSLSNGFYPISETMGMHGNIIEREGLRGTRSRFSADMRDGLYTVGGTVTFEPTPIDLTFWWPFILGAYSTGSGTLTETLPSFTLAVQRNSKNFMYAGCTVNRATFSCSQGSMLRMSLDIVGSNAPALNATSWPALTPDVTGPYVFSDMTLTLTSAILDCRDFELVIDNSLITDRFMNTTTVVSLPTADRHIGLKLTTAWDTATAAIYALYTSTGVGASGGSQAGSGFAGATLLLTYSSGTYSTTFTFGQLNANMESPTAATRQENWLTTNWIARQTGATKELVVTHAT